MNPILSNLLDNAASVKSAAEHIAKEDIFAISMRIWTDLFGEERWNEPNLARGWVALFTGSAREYAL